MREAITLQVGPYSNYVGAHFWNLQDEVNAYSAAGVVPEIDLDVLFRETKNARGASAYVPRAICCDYQENFGWLGLGGGNAAEHGPAVESLWSGKVERVDAEAVQPSPYVQGLMQEVDSASVETPSNLEIEASARHWPDFAKVEFHERSLAGLPPAVCASSDSESIGGLNGYIAGAELAKGSWGDDLLERMRWFVEECDNLQGFQVFCDTSGYFSAIASALIESIRDDFGSSSSVLSFHLHPPLSQSTVLSENRRLQQSLSENLGVASLTDASSVIVPIAALPPFPYAPACQPQKWYHAAAFHAASLDSLTVGSRIRAGAGAVAFSLDSLVGSLRCQERLRVASAWSAVPLPVFADAPLDQVLEPVHPVMQPAMVALSPVKGPHVFFSEHCVVRGWPGSASHTHQSLLHLCARQPCIASTCIVGEQQVLIPGPFPQVFAPVIGRLGRPQHKSKDVQDISECAVEAMATMGHLGTHSGFKGWASTISQQLCFPRSIATFRSNTDISEVASGAASFLADIAEAFDSD